MVAAFRGATFQLSSSVQIPVEAARFSRAALRRELRARRRSLGARERRGAALELLDRLLGSTLLRCARRVAVYLPADGEIDPAPIAAHLLDRGARIHLPVIDPMPRGSARLRFAPVRPGVTMTRNRFGIAEPQGTGSVAGWTLDLVLLPLVGFDRRGGRLGMGGGFYDRTFDLDRPRPMRPRLVGLAHACQEVDQLPLAAHDVPLDALVTDRDFFLTDR